MAILASRGGELGLLMDIVALGYRKSKLGGDTETVDLVNRQS